jgi:hypothetical protein
MTHLKLLNDASFNKGIKDSTYISAQQIVPLLMDLKSACDVGYEIGTWLAAHGRNKDCNVRHRARHGQMDFDSFTKSIR